MSVAWIAQVLFFLCYAVAYYLNVSVPHNGWTFVSALAAFVIAILLVIDNRGFLSHNRTN